MTREEAIEKLYIEWQKFLENNIDYAGVSEAYKMAFKALEQKFVLDKIKAEIWNLQYGNEEKSMTDEDRADAYNNAIKQAIEIINKYQVESEV